MSNLEKAQTCFAIGFFTSSMAGILVNKAWMVVAMANVLTLLATSIWELHKEELK